MTSLVDVAKIPPKCIVRARSDHKSNSPLELSFRTGDYFMVVNTKPEVAHLLAHLTKHDEWLEVADPVRGVKGLVPAGMFEVVTQQKQETPYRNQSLRRPSAEMEFASTPLVAVLLYDFVAQRPDELSAKKGDRMIVAAYSNSFAWIICSATDKPHISPGLIPVNYVSLEDPRTKTKYQDPKKAVMQHNIPKISEWKERVKKRTSKQDARKRSLLDNSLEFPVRTSSNEKYASRVSSRTDTSQRSDLDSYIKYEDAISQDIRESISEFDKNPKLVGRNDDTLIPTKNWREDALNSTSDRFANPVKQTFSLKKSEVSQENISSRQASQDFALPLKPPIKTSSIQDFTLPIRNTNTPQYSSSQESLKASNTSQESLKYSKDSSKDSLKESKLKESMPKESMPKESTLKESMPKKSTLKESTLKKSHQEKNTEIFSETSNSDLQDMPVRVKVKFVRSSDEGSFTVRCNTVDLDFESMSKIVRERLCSPNEMCWRRARDELVPLKNTREIRNAIIENGDNKLVVYIY